MKKYLVLALCSVVAVAFSTSGCGGGTTETHNVTIHEHYVPTGKPAKKNPESFEPVERF